MKFLATFTTAIAIAAATTPTLPGASSCVESPISTNQNREENSDTEALIEGTKRLNLNEYEIIADTEQGPQFETPMGHQQHDLKEVPLVEKKSHSGEITEQGDDQKVKLSKRGYVLFQAFHRFEKGGGFRTSGNLDPGKCTGGFSRTANFLQWSVHDQSCRFTLYKGGRCRGKVVFDTGGFNVVSDGSRHERGFNSVYVECH